jgi:hypothetical protein
MPLIHMKGPGEENVKSHLTKFSEEHFLNFETIPRQ